MSSKKILFSLLPWILVAIIAYFFGKTLADNLDKLNDVSFTVDVWAVLGTLLLTLAVVVSGFLWATLLSTLSGKPVSLKEGARIHAASWLLKYVPGQVGSLLNKLAWGTKRGFSKKTITTSFLYENILTVFASVLVALPAVLLFKDHLGSELTLLLPLLVVIPMLVILYRPFFYGVLNKVFSLLGKKPFAESDFLSGKALLKYQLGYLVPRILNGVGFVFIAASLLPVEPHMYLGLAAAFVLASVVGLLAVFVPGGLGVREAIIVLLVSVYFPVEQAIILSIVARLYATVADIGVALVYIILNKGRIKQL